MACRIKVILFLWIALLTSCSPIIAHVEVPVNPPLDQSTQPVSPGMENPVAGPTLLMPSGLRIAFMGAKPNGNFGIYLTDGIQKTRLTSESSSDASPTCSPDGSRIAFSSDRDGKENIYIMNLDGSHPTRLTHNGVRNTDPQWLPNGTQIAFIATSGDGYFQWDILNSNGMNASKFMEYTVYPPEPSWSPDGKRIAYVDYEDQKPRNDAAGEIYLMNIDGTGRRRLTDNIWHDMFPAWSPDGTKIAYISDAGHYGEMSIYIMKADGTDQRKLVIPLDASEDRIAWSPDSRQIAFVGGGGFSLVKIDGSGLIQLTGGGDLDSVRSPTWCL
jgi:Tol biopolymer transport system component